MWVLNIFDVQIYFNYLDNSYDYTPAPQFLYIHSTSQHAKFLIQGFCILLFFDIQGL